MSDTKTKKRPSEANNATAQPLPALSAPAPAKTDAGEKAKNWFQLSMLDVVWRQRDNVTPNKYNPNVMMEQERALLQISMLEDGWTQPIVVRPTKELVDDTPRWVIVDGEQRWTVSVKPLYPFTVNQVLDRIKKRAAAGADISQTIVERLRFAKTELQAALDQGEIPTLLTLTKGLVPTTILNVIDDAHIQMSTIRHNRARGTMDPLAMAALTDWLVQEGFNGTDLQMRLGMPQEEVLRFLRVSRPLALGQTGSPLTNPAALIAADQSLEATAAFKAYQEAMLARQQYINAEAKKQEAAIRNRGESVSILDRQEIRKKLEAATPAPTLPPRQQLSRIVAVFTKEEYDHVTATLGDRVALKLLEICRAFQDHKRTVARWRK